MEGKKIPVNNTNGYPVIPKEMNARLFPEGPQPNVDMIDPMMFVDYITIKDEKPLKDLEE